MTLLLTSFYNITLDSALSFSVNPGLFLVPLKLQLHLCLDSIILFLFAFSLLLLRKKFTSFYSVQTFCTAFMALLLAVFLNLDNQQTLSEILIVTKTQSLALFWDAFEISPLILKWKFWFFLGNIFILIFLYGSFKQNSSKDQLYFTLPLMILLLSASGSLVLTSSNLLTLMLTIETFSFLGLYVIRLSSNKMSAEASLLYFFMNLLSTGFLSLGFLLIYIGTGEYTITHISDVILSYYSQGEGIRINSNITIGLGLLLGTFLFKIAAFPCFFWMPLTFRAMSFAGVSVTSYTIKFINVCLFVKLSSLVLPSYLLLTSNALWILICAFGSILVGTFLALNEFNFRKFLAFTSINQMGYVLLGFLPLASHTTEALDGILYFLFIYFLSSLLFLSTLANIRVNNLQINNLSDLRTLYQLQPQNLWFCLLAIFTMAGLPPTAGFWAKYYIIRNCWDSSLVINWDISFIYTLRIILGFTIFLNFFSAIYYVRLVIMLVFNTLNIVWSDFKGPTSYATNVHSRLWAACKASRLPTFRHGLKHIMINQWGTIPSIMRQATNETLNFDFVLSGLQILSAIYLIGDFISRLF